MRRLELCWLLAVAPLAHAAELARIPEVTLADLQGAKVKLIYTDSKITLVNFWATWCAPCREEMPMIAKLVDRYGKRGFKAVGIAVESGEPSDVKRFIERNRDLGVNYAILVGDDAALEKFDDLDVVPTTFLVDPTGKVIKKYVGVTKGFYEKIGEEVGRHLSAAGDAGKSSSKAGRPAPSAKP